MSSNRFHTKKHRIICPYEDCQETLVTLVKQMKHLFEKHLIQIELEEKTFNEATSNYIFLIHSSQKVKINTYIHTIEFQKWKVKCNKI